MAPSFLGLEEMKRKSAYLQILAEFLGTFLLISLALCGSTTLQDDQVKAILGTGLLLTSVIQIIGRRSGGHVNPAVTLGAFAGSRIKMLKALCYIIAQIFGALAGSLTSHALTDPRYRGLMGASVIGPDEDYNKFKILGMELLMTFVLVAVVLSVTHGHDGGPLGFIPLAIGVALTACLCMCLPYTGSLNPARSFGPAIVMNQWDDHWIFWVGPLLGGLLAGVVYSFLIAGEMPFRFDHVREADEEGA